jgi:hypothetical protein
MKDWFRVHRPGASPRDIQNLLTALDHGLPDAYIALLNETNGAESAIHDQRGDCLHLWPTDAIIQLNHDYQIARWLPDVVAIGDNGGDDAIVLDMRASPDPNDWPVVRVGFGDLDRASFHTIAPNFGQWIAQAFGLVRQTGVSTSA